MALDTFPQFLNLPKEIQLLIWEAAARTSDRHVHRFFIAQYHFKSPSPLSRRQEDLLQWLGTSAVAYENVNFLQLLGTRTIDDENVNFVPSFSFAVPIDDIDGNRNDSVYLSDSSLWTFSKDSRQAMEKRFRKNEWWSHIKSPYHPKHTATPGNYLGQEGASHTASYRDDNGGVKHITIDFDRDLIHLDPCHLNHLPLLDPLHDSLPLFDCKITPRPKAKPSFVGENIALDYDVSILDVFLGRKVHYRKKELRMGWWDFRMILHRLLNGMKRTIWFIDYGLSYQNATENVSNREDGSTHGTRADLNSQPVRETFRSEDFIYTEVQREDIGPVWLPRNDEVENSEGSTVFDMFDYLADRLDTKDLDRLRVLACQPRPGRLTQPRRPWAKRCPGDSTCEGCGVEELEIQKSPWTSKGGGLDGFRDTSFVSLFD
ncbi:hypothetical protein ACHAPA_003512 [Fusarium lateritium]